jgi:hypothetical protein
MSASAPPIGLPSESMSSQVSVTTVSLAICMGDEASAMRGAFEELERPQLYRDE